MNAEQRGRLVALRDLMARTPSGRDFKMSAWKCGTARCAVGAGMDAGILPGLEWNVFFESNVMGFAPTYLGNVGWRALANYFGVDIADTHHLFSSKQYDVMDPTPLHVARRMTEWLDAHPESTP